MTAIVLLRCLLVAIGLVALMPGPVRAGDAPRPASGLRDAGVAAARLVGPSKRVLPWQAPALLEAAGTASAPDEAEVARSAIVTRPPAEAPARVRPPRSAGAAGTPTVSRLDRPPKHA